MAWRDMQDIAPAKTAASEPQGPARPPHVERPRWVWPLIVAGLVLAAALFYVSYIYPQPAITLSDFSYVTTLCSRLGNSSTEYYTYFVTLTNSGTSDGFAQVSFSMDGSFVGYSRYFVPRGTPQRILWTTDWPDCGTHTPSAAVTAVSRT